VPANRLAREIGEERVANMVLLGAYLVRNRFLTMENIKDSLRELIGQKGERLLSYNFKALELGARI
ncbi:MAG: 2-oxoacid:ferredoxin oxidoreductase subunit gamma, partial [Halanaerobiaceae bacterium]|nr:2-oxoacid:ferredoxin oxidoreductase subunit gamma [Halanaerobiaceae bacterium]